MNQLTQFQSRCYKLLKEIPEGKITTYKELARALGIKAWRSVGSAMAKNQQLISVPCHRVVRSNGEVGEYALGTDTKAALLTKEGVAVKNGKVQNLDLYFYRFS